MANAFNFHYANVGSNLAEKIEKSPPIVNADMNYTLFLHPTDETEIIKCITELKNEKAPGKDGIKAETIKLIVDYIVKPICFVFNNVLESGIYPDKLKIAVIKPLFKHGDKTAIENYRPISLISNFSKILEKIIKNRLTKYVSKHNIVAETQYGFQEHKSTNDAIAKLTSLMYDALDKSNPSLVVFLDLAKAFDTISHSQLLQKLQSVGCRGVPFQLFSNYLKGRKQCVKIDNNISEYEIVKYGVPQGTVLGPILFTIYINDILTQNSDGRMISFADDKLYFTQAKAGTH